VTATGNGRARSRRANTLPSEWEALDAASVKILGDERPLSVRGVLYRLTNRDEHAHLTLHRVSRYIRPTPNVTCKSGLPSCASGA
jgi:hypothetical protein